MSDLNYGLGFYLIEIATNHYDLYNTVTDNKILEAQPKEKIVNFLELNLPTHPFLYQVDQETDPFFFSGHPHAEEINKYFEYVDENDSPNNPAYYLNDKYKMNFDNYSVAADDEHFYNSFNYGNTDDFYMIDEDGMRKEYPDNNQLEFNFTYKDNKNVSKANPSKNSPDIEDEEIPYLPDDTDE